MRRKQKKLREKQSTASRTAICDQPNSDQRSVDSIQLTTDSKQPSTERRKQNATLRLRSGTTRTPNAKHQTQKLLFNFALPV
jgi:hypothetical protein